VTRSARKYVLDTQLFINAFRDSVANEELRRFHRGFSPFEHLSVIVAQELRAGVKRPQDRKALERYVLTIFKRAGRTITPSAGAWHRSGDLLAEMARQEGLEIARVSKAFANDVLLAVVPRGGMCPRDGQRTGFRAHSLLRSIRLHEAVAWRSDALVNLRSRAEIQSGGHRARDSSGREDFIAHEKKSHAARVNNQ
jgi:predicted nucleic acid-binding protein